MMVDATENQLLAMLSRSKTHTPMNMAVSNIMVAAYLR